MEPQPISLLSAARPARNLPSETHYPNDELAERGISGHAGPGKADRGKRVFSNRLAQVHLLQSAVQIFIITEERIACLRKPTYVIH